MELEGASTVSQMNPTMNLRKVCNHPFLFGEPREASGEFIGDAKPQLMMMASGKLKLLDRMLPKLRKAGHKVLIFSQMTKLMDILQDYLHWRSYKCCRLDGSTPLDERRRLIESFNNDADSFLFLLSTRSGGQGINLAAADTVILFDSDYNPHMDAQAEARCHRIGQHRPVITYRLLTAGSVEIEMMEKQISKKKLERLTIYGGDFRKAGERSGSNLTLTRLRELLEDDVKNLDRNSRGGADIAEEELDLIMDRDSIFQSWESTVIDGDVGASASKNKRKSSPNSVMMQTSQVPMEGKMYDIVIVDESLSLGGVN
jgi:ATP-dependent DNA helicase